MKVIERTVLNSDRSVVCVYVEECDYSIKEAFFSARTAIWTTKYAERVSENGFEIDEFDDRSGYIALLDEVSGEIVGGCRIIYARNNEPLPIGDCVSISHYSAAIEISRFFLLRVQGVTDQPELLTWFVRSLNVHLVCEGYTSAFATIRECLYKKLCSIGVPMGRIGPNQVHEGTQFIPVTLWSMDQSANEVAA